MSIFHKCNSPLKFFLKKNEAQFLMMRSVDKVLKTRL